jgi:hypothetical protein
MINFTDSVFVVIGVALAGWAGRVVWRGWRARRWPAAPGQVIGFDFREGRGRRGRPYIGHLELRYRYAVGGAAFEGRRVGFGLEHETPSAALAPDRVTLGTPLIVYYDPRDPGEAVLRRDVPAFEVVCALGGLVLVAAGLLGVL